MSENKKDTNKSNDERRYAVPQGYSWYGIPSGHSHSGKHLQKGGMTESINEKWLYTRSLFVTIVSVCFLGFILVDQGINEDTWGFFGFWSIVFIIAAFFTFKSRRDLKKMENDSLNERQKVS
ncbi:hypothetical protein CEE45_16265 [Candidatus Heimdallarchaeota archaeon B3_Heim]|nr:MAG: hypothetical protein CEE45_16265 [Candidatus Heimdallarchaeota archaeon B3_Heim]